MSASNKYLSTTEMVNGVHKKTKAPIPCVASPGDFRVFRPSKMDVLCGRGKPIQDHKGNQRMRDIVFRHAHRYMKARKHDKQLVVEEVVALIKNSDGVLARFLQRVGRENYWVEAPSSTVFEKVSHGLRCFAREIRHDETTEEDDLPPPTAKADEEVLQVNANTQSRLSSGNTTVRSSATFMNDLQVAPRTIPMSEPLASSTTQPNVSPSEWQKNELLAGQVLPSLTARRNHLTSLLPFRASSTEHTNQSRQMITSLPASAAPRIPSTAELIELLARHRVARELRLCLSSPADTSLASIHDSRSHAQQIVRQALMNENPFDRCCLQRQQVQLQQRRKQEVADLVTLAVMAAASARDSAGSF